MLHITTTCLLTLTFQVVYWEVSRLSVYRDGTNTILEEVTSDVLTAVEGGEDGAG